MDHFSASCDSTASLFIFVRIGFEPCNSLYLAAVTLLGPAIFFLWQDVVFVITAICLLILSVAL